MGGGRASVTFRPHPQKLLGDSGLRGKANEHLFGKKGLFSFLLFPPITPHVTIKHSCFKMELPRGKEHTRPGLSACTFIHLLRKYFYELDSVKGSGNTDCLCSTGLVGGRERHLIWLRGGDQTSAGVSKDKWGVWSGRARPRAHIHSRGKRAGAHTAHRNRIGAAGLEGRGVRAQEETRLAWERKAEDRYAAADWRCKERPRLCILKPPRFYPALDGF